jgi:hypothetical protein
VAASSPPYEFSNSTKLIRRCRLGLRLDSVVKPDDAFADRGDDSPATPNATRYRCDRRFTQHRIDFFD